MSRTSGLLVPETGQPFWRTQRADWAVTAPCPTRPADTTAARGPVLLPVSPMHRMKVCWPVPSRAAGSIKGAAGSWASTLHRAGEEEVVLDQPHALGVHELKRRQDLSQHPLAGAESLQNLSKARATCTGHSTSGTRLQGLTHSHPGPRNAACPPLPAGGRGDPAERQRHCRGKGHWPASTHFTGLEDEDGKAR